MAFLPAYAMAKARADLTDANHIQSVKFKDGEMLTERAASTAFITGSNVQQWA